MSTEPSNQGFLYLAPLFGLLLWKRDRTASLGVMFASTIAALAIHLSVYVWNPDEYGPLHLISKGDRLLSDAVLITALISCSIVGIYTLYKLRDHLENWALLLWLCLITPLTFVGYGGLAQANFVLPLWEGDSYLLVTLPVYIFFFVCFDDVISDEEHTSVSSVDDVSRAVRSE